MAGPKRDITSAARGTRPHHLAIALERAVDPELVRITWQKPAEAYDRVGAVGEAARSRRNAERLAR